jgi:hypothetical protein
MKNNEIIKYAKAMQVQEDVINWIETHLFAYLEKNKADQTEVEHIIDYLASDKRPKRLSKMSYEQAKSNTEKWNKALIKKGKNIIEKEDDVELIKDFGDGFKVVKLVGKAAYEREGALMRHCCASYYGLNKEVYSLRDKNNIPHCTIEKDQQIKGKGNGEVSPKYIGYIVEFLESIGMMVGDNEMKNIGYVNVSKIKDKLSKKKNNFYKDYLPINKTWYGADDSEYSELDLLNYKDPISIDSSMKVVVNFKLEDFLPKAIKKLLKSVEKGRLRNASSGYNSRNASSGNDSQNASSGYDSRNASSGDRSQNASIEGYSHNASSGNDSQNASSGDYSQNTSSGDYSQNTSSGLGSRNASSGYDSQNASSGNRSQNASSGYGSQNASSGYDSRNASSGYRSQNASSGYGSQNASSGYDSRNASSGYRSQNASSGYGSQNASSGDESRNASSGYGSQNASSGYGSHNASSGNDSQNASSGNRSRNASSGNRSRNASSGDESKNEASGEHSVIVDAGSGGQVKGINGTLVALTHYIEVGGRYIPEKIVTGQIGKKGLKENVWYKLNEAGSFEEVKND